MATGVTRISALWRQGWTEIPEVMATSGLALIGIGLSGLAYALGKQRGTWNRKYKNKPMVMRSDDPRVPHIVHDSHLD